MPRQSDPLDLSVPQRSKLHQSGLSDPLVRLPSKLRPLVRLVQSVLQQSMLHPLGLSDPLVRPQLMQPL
jgi:hypothetical protein